ncbi:MAG: hypothetical protein U5Q03_19080 [Bacteroidota bacterium]|nr:hypothetical protein [Bacteroidota bacterium]
MKASNLYSLIPVLFKMYRAFGRQQKFLKLAFSELYRRVGEENDGTVTSGCFYKMTRYYGFAVPAVLGEGICMLRGYKMNETERRLSTSQGIITGIYDDFIDKNRLQADQIIKITRKPGDFSSDELITQIFIEHWSYVIEHIMHEAFLWQMVEKIYKVQLETKKQYDPGLSFDSIRQITFDKGGYSVLFYRSVFSNQLMENEFEAFYKLGALLQFGNDIFDLKFDLEEGINTMITKSDHLQAVINIFYELKEDTIRSFYRLPYRHKDIRNFLHFIMPVVSRCEVCLNHLHKLEKTAGMFRPRDHSRKEIVCDMEKMSNFLRTLKYYLNTDI